jgi:YrbI family 3-deoxy-D-manno-octulosonate 8-phosphate phosphatase
VPGASLVRQLKSLTLLVFDYDGVFTDNRVLVTDDGHEAVLCNRSDGLGLAALRRIGLPVLILSTEANPVVAHRARKLQTECIHGCDDKWTALKEILAARGLDAATVAFVGNDINDLECLQHVGLPICVADAYPAVRKVARMVTRRRGGDGAVREICEAIVQARGTR